MLQYDSNDKVLHAYKNKCAIPRVEEMLDTSQSVIEDLAQYYNKQACEDFWEYIKPEFEAIFNDGNVPKITMIDKRVIRCDIDDIALDRYNTTEKLDSYAINGYNKNRNRILVDRSTLLQVRFSVPRLPDEKAEWVTVLKLPEVNPQSGVITYEGAEYLFTYMLEQSDGISYNSNLGNKKKPCITVRTNKNTMHLEPGSKGIVVMVRDNITGLGGDLKPRLTAVMGGMLRNEGFDVEEVWSEFRDTDIINLFRKDGVFTKEMYYYGIDGQCKYNMEDMDKLIARLSGTSITANGTINKIYDTSKVRDELNEVLSLKAAVGQQLHLPAVDDNGKVIKAAGTVLTDEDILDIQKAGIYKLYIRSIPTIVGATLTHPIYLNVIYPGTLVSDTIQKAFPEEDGMYVTQLHRIEDYTNLEQKLPFIIEEKTVITPEIMSLLVNSGVEKVNVLLGTQKVRKDVYFCNEIISNRQFKGSWIGKSGEDANKWFYKNVDGQYICQDTIYGFTAYDFVALLSCSTKVFDDRPYVNIPNIDMDFRKTLATPSIQFQRAMRDCAMKAVKKARRSLRDIAMNNSNAFHEEGGLAQQKCFTFTQQFKDYLIKTSKCLRRISQDAYINPVSYISEVTKANVYVKGKHSVTDSQRRIAIGSYGKIDGFEIPQSGKMGVVNNLTLGAHFDSSGRITTPYHKVTMRGGKCVIDLNNITYLDVIEEEKEVIADICSLNVADDGTIMESPEDYILCRVPGVSIDERQLFERYPIKEITYVTHNAVQTLSWSSAVIPFISNNDAARAVFAIAQLKQCKGHRNAETPSVMTTAYKMLPMMNDIFGLVAPKDGYVVQAGVDKKKDTHICNLEFPDKGATTRYTGAHDSDPEGYRRERSLYLTGTNSYTDFKYNYEATQGDVNFQSYEDKTPIKAGRAAIGSNFVADDGYLKLGCDLLVAYRPNYNYEDSTCLSESAARKMTTYRVNKEVFLMPPSRRMYFIKNESELKEGMVGANETRNKVEIGYHDSSGEKLKEFAIEEAYGKFLLQLPHIKDKMAFDGVELWLLSENEATIGDKFSNRHGNKATVSKIFPDAEMPRLKNGMAIEMELNPLGVGTRMNIGQIMEIHLGIVCHVLGIRLCADAYNGISNEEVKMLLSFAVDLADSTGDISSILNSYNVPESLKTHCRNNIDKIRFYANCFTKRGTARLILPDHDGKMTETECTVGWVHEFKLIQESEKKIHARANEMSDEPYSLISDAPTKGASNAGGQRLGNMEVSALAAYNANGLLKEIMNERSDNAIARNNFNVKTFLNSKLGADLLEEGKGQRRSVTQLLYTLLALGIFTETTEDEIIPLSKDNHYDLARPKPLQLRKISSRYKDRVKAHSDSVQTTGGSVIDDLAAGLSMGSEEDMNSTPTPVQPSTTIQQSEPTALPQSDGIDAFKGFAADAINKMGLGKTED